jgi:hypothetical protein
MRIIFTLNGIEINDPNNWAELEIELNYDKNNNNEVVSINNWELGVGQSNNAKDGAVIANRHILGGQTGSVGVFEGVPFNIDLDNELGQKLDLFKGYLDMSRAHVECDFVDAPAIERGGIDWLNEVIDSVSYETLVELKKITKNDYIPVPYVINKKVSAGEIIIAVVSVFVVVQTLKQQFNELLKWGFGVAGILNAIASILSLVIQIAYIVTLLIALVRLVLDLYNMLVQPVKYHLGMYAVDSLRIGLEHFGLKLSSSILETHPYNKMVIIPEKYNLKEDNLKGLKAVAGYFKPNPNEQVGYYKGTPGDLLRALQLMFHAKIDIRDGILHFEKQNFQIPAPLYQLPALEDTGYEFNSEDFISNYIISFAIDQSDRNTVQEYTGTKVQIQTLPKTITNKDMVLLRNLVQQNIGFALGKRKTSFTLIEEFLLVLFKEIDKIVGFMVKIVNEVIVIANNMLKTYNAMVKAMSILKIKLVLNPVEIKPLVPPNFTNLIEGRINMLKMETDFIAVPKVVLIDNHTDARNNVLLANNEEHLNARFLWDGYHYFVSFIPQKGSKGNQYLKRRVDSPIPFCFDDYKKVRKNSAIFDSDGTDGKLIGWKFNPKNETVTGTYKIHHIYTTNLVEKIIEPDGK